MRRRFMCIWGGGSMFTCLALWACQASGVVAEKPGAGDEPVEPTRVLLITGGGWHDFDNQPRVLMEGVDARVDFEIDWTLYDGGRDPTHTPVVMREDHWAQPYDLIVHLYAYGRVNDADFVEHMVEHHKGTPAVILHASTMSFRHSEPADSWFDFLGVKTTWHENRRPITIENIAPDHPIVATFPESWDTTDVVNGELYVIEEVRGELTELTRAYGVQTETHHITSWIHTPFEDTRVFSTTLGHYTTMYEQEPFMDMVTNGLLWALERLE